MKINFKKIKDIGKDIWEGLIDSRGILAYDMFILKFPEGYAKKYNITFNDLDEIKKCFEIPFTCFYGEPFFPEGSSEGIVAMLVGDKYLHMKKHQTLQDMFEYVGVTKIKPQHQQ